MFIIVLSLWAILICPLMRAPELLWSNAVIATAAFACTVRSFSLMGQGVWETQTLLFSLGIGASSWLAYTWQRHVKSTRKKGLRPDHLEWHRTRWPAIRILAWVIFPLALLPALLSILALAQGKTSLDLPTALVFGSALAVTLLYAGWPGEEGARFALRRIPGLKMIWVGLSWATITAAWPAWWSGALESMPADSIAMLIGERFLIITALTLPFDLRDRQWDPPSMRNWSTGLGTAGTRALALTCLIAANGLLWAESEGSLWWAMAGTVPMCMAVLAAREDRPAHYFGFLDGLLILDALWICFWVG